MKDHLQRIKEREEETKRQRKNNTKMVRLLAVLILLCFSLSGMVGVLMTIGPKEVVKSSDEKEKTEAAADEQSEDDKWQLIIVNKDHLLPSDFTVDLIAFEKSRVDYRISVPLSNMISDAENDGITLTVCSAYRSVSQQKEIYEAKIQSFKSQGYSDEASKIYANQFIQPPGASEHHTGLAVDFETDKITSLDESFAQTPAYEWLKKNAVKYGFIERYTNDKTNITGVSWEPWHFRYVGVDNAKAITSIGICLEEYT